MQAKKIIAFFAVLNLCIFSGYAGVWAQEPTAADTAVPAVAASPEGTSSVADNGNSDTQWVWGEVVSMDPAARSFVLKYLDYETDQEKNISLGVNEKTIYENIKSFDEIKAQDALSVDYTLAEDGQNLAKNISLEKPEILPEAAAVETANVAQPSAGETSGPDIITSHDPEPAGSVVTVDPNKEPVAPAVSAADKVE